MRPAQPPLHSSTNHSRGSSFRSHRRIWTRRCRSCPPVGRIRPVGSTSEKALRFSTLGPSGAASSAFGLMRKRLLGQSLISTTTGGTPSDARSKVNRAIEFPVSEQKPRLNANRFSGLFGVISPDNSENLSRADGDTREPGKAQAYPHHECGLFGVFGHDNAAVLTYYGLFALQHRGQESAGIVTSNGPGTSFLLHKDMGLVSQVFGQAELAQLKGTRAIGHTRYSTTGTSTVKNAQPFVVDCVRGQMAIARKGTLIN